MHKDFLELVAAKFNIYSILSGFYWLKIRFYIVYIMFRWQQQQSMWLGKKVNYIVLVCNTHSNFWAEKSGKIVSYTQIITVLTSTEMAWFVNTFFLSPFPLKKKNSLRGYTLDDCWRMGSSKTLTTFSIQRKG